RQAINFHEAKLSTAADVKCTWDLLLDNTNDKLRLNPRKSSYDNLAAVITKGENFQTAGPDADPVVNLFYGCGSGLNWDGYCNPEVDKMIEQQSREADPDRRKRLLWTIERKLAEDNARPIIYYRPGGTCMQPYVKDLTIDINYILDS